MKTEIVTSYERNKKLYVLLEIDADNKENSGMDLESFRLPGSLGDLGDLNPIRSINWIPKWSDFSCKAWVENGKGIIALTYKDSEKWRYEFELNVCTNLDDFDIFSETVLGIGVTVYLRYIYICALVDEHNNPAVKFSFQVWAKSSIGKTKLGEIDQKISIPV